jgi:hypothetical protein
MQSDGGLASIDHFSGHKAILSGPAGGYCGYALTTRWPGANLSKLQVAVHARVASCVVVCCRRGLPWVEQHRFVVATSAPFPAQVIGFDMGGTSTDVSR